MNLVRILPLSSLLMMEEALYVRLTCLSYEIAKWAVLDRVEAAGLLPRVAGPHWSVFEIFRNAPIIDTLLEAGDIEEVQSGFSPP